ncbi:uncharacterized protein LOC111705729 [Eurytemora carolleeae]|uniref:uncharacterized protein LOC111705729 n=1 Tax=Eurytemora carolleeae TaxID=1294199 RepID=UPI000C7791E0|nr:uncharacterized protein LOC111705729 [Eurytemora carolleeae]|eukprot:XP_023334144.1 uncharacterized protein LOC111705729 [Eurytemora affinis]
MREKYMRLREQNPPIFTPKPPPTILPFDSLERYTQHAVTGRYNPLRPVRISPLNISWEYYDGMKNTRDKKGLNSYIWLPWDKVTTEPSDIRFMYSSCSCWYNLCKCTVRPPWNESSRLYRDTKHQLYQNNITSCLIIFLGVLFGLIFGFVSFLQIWILTPSKKLMQIQRIMIRKLMKVCFGEIAASLVTVFREMFSTSKLNISTLQTPLNGIFLEKRPKFGSVEEPLYPGKMVNTSKEKYPDVKHIKLPMMNY